MPEDELRSVWPSLPRDDELFQDIARHFKVSRLVVARRALDLTLIDRDRFLEFYRSCQNAELRVTAGREGGDFFAIQSFRVGRRFASTVIRAAQERQVSYAEAYELTGLYGAAFDKYAAHLGFRSPQ